MNTYTTNWRLLSLYLWQFAKLLTLHTHSILSTNFAASVAILRFHYLPQFFPIWVSNSSRFLNMFFVAYFADVNQYVVIPKNWILDEKIIYKKFINHGGINSDQWYLCYWTTKKEAHGTDGEPMFTYAPDFDTDIENEFPCTEGCFFGRLVSNHRK